MLKVLAVVVLAVGITPSVWAKGDMDYCEEFAQIHASLARIEKRQYSYQGRITAVETKAVIAGASTSLLFALVSAVWLKSSIKEK